MSALLEALEREGRTLSQRVLEEMYKDPFWTERFGARGRRHADEDSDFHLRYLARALAAGQADVLVRYAVWLREVLATRGMCTRHLDENFRLLAGEISARSWPGHEQAVAFLARAREALLHEDREARELQRRTEAMGEAIAKAFRARRPEGWTRADARGSGALRDDACNYVSYIADALAFGNAATLVAHTGWFAAHVKSHGADARDLDVFFACVREALETNRAGDRALGFLGQATAA
jgi:hypothetical protein